jgi:hypothetical protein
MELNIKLLKDLKRTDLIPDFYREKPDDYLVNVHALETRLTKAEIETLKNLAAKEYKKYRAKEEGTLSKISTTYVKLLDLAKFIKSDSSLVVSSLDTLETALKQYVETSPMRWMFLELKDKTFAPYYVNSIKYLRSYSRDEQARVVMHLVYEAADGTLKGRSFSFYKEDLRTAQDDVIDNDDNEDEEGKKKSKSSGVKVSTLCKFKKLHLGTDEMYTRYKGQIERFNQLKGTTGVPLSLANPDAIACYATTSTWREEATFDTYRLVKTVFGDKGFVTDENENEVIKPAHFYSWYAESNEKTAAAIGNAFWGSTFAFTIPIHARLKCFDFTMRNHCMIHVDYIVKRTFNVNLREKLVLPEKDKIFLDMLMGTSKVKSNDIVSGKSGGMIILGTGLPGTGKTLTAEIYSEEMNKPLYSVQCSELGIDPEKLEKNLAKVLKRAERWNSILLLDEADEADVYIRERGEDIRQNAIVGVFLRVLEYYTGILFMTTNKLQTNIDDAIISRCSAHIRYKNFTGELLKQAWMILSAQLEVPLSKKDIDHLCGKWVEVSGRSIKNLINLSKHYSIARDVKPSAEIIETVSEYLPAFKPE